MFKFQKANHCDAQGRQNHELGLLQEPHVDKSVAGVGVIAFHEVKCL